MYSRFYEQKKGEFYHPKIYDQIQMSKKFFESRIKH